jgi:hypothetical protein
MKIADRRNIRFSVIVIDLTIFNSIEDIQRFLDSAGFPKWWDDAEALWVAKCGLDGTDKKNKIWIDSKTGWCIGYETATSRIFYEQFVEYLGKMSPVGIDFKLELDDLAKDSPEFPLTLDGLLDKIKALGFSRLSPEEVTLLQELSK